MSLTPAELARPDDVSDADAKRYYDSNLARYGTPERRQLEQIVFPTLEEAQAAAARIGESLSFEALAKERGMEAKDIDIGLLTKSAIIDRAIADAAFALQEGAVSAPIKGTFGTVLIKVVKIETEQIKKFEEVAPEIKQTLATERARRELSARHDKIEDERGGGLRLAEIAPKLGLTALTIAAVDRSGLDPDGKKVEGLPSGVDVISSAFAADVGVDAEPLQIPGGGYVWFDVTGVTPARERNLDDVRAQVEERWRNDEVSKRLRAKATEMADKLKARHAVRRRRGGRKPAGADHVRAEARRATATPPSRPRSIDAVFQTAKDAAGIAEGNSPAEWVVFRVTDITVSDFDAASPEVKRIADQMRRSLTEDMLAQYVQRLRDRYRRDHQSGRVAPGLVGQHRPELMQIEPSPEAFAARYARGEPQAVWTTLVGDLETPVSAFLKVAGGRANSFLFELVEGGAVRGRYSMIGLEPDLIWRADGTRAEINRTARARPDAFAPCPDAPLAALRALIAESRIALPENLPPMAAGLFGYLGYDMVRLMEELPPPNPDAVGIPGRDHDPPDGRDRVRRREGHDHGGDAGAARGGRCGDGRVQPRHRTALRDRRRARPPARQGSRRHAKPGRSTFRPPRTRRRPNTRAMVARAKEYIAAGDIFQVVLSQRFEAPFSLSPFSLYRALRRVNPAPFLFFLDFGGFAVAGSSPEILVRVRGGTVTVRPIAGTRPRGETPHEDKALEDELLADPKERAEHLMLLDLGRNDVGRVAEIGSVTVTDQFFIERYSHVMHIVSNVEGKLGAAPRRGRRARGRFSRRHGVGRAEGARDGNHRRTGEGEARALRRLGRLLLGRRRDGHLHRAAHRAGEGRHDVRAGRRRDRGGQQSRLRAAGMHQQVARAVPRRRGGAPLRERGEARAVRWCHSGRAKARYARLRRAMATPGIHSHRPIGSMDRQPIWSSAAGYGFRARAERAE